MISSREAAYLAILASLRNEKFIENSLNDWLKQSSPTITDYRLAERLACGTMQMSLTLDYLATQLTSNKKLSLKQKERVLVRLALYQFYFLERVPLYAITDESIKIAKKYCHSSFIGFLNATLRSLEKNPPKMPSGNSISDISTEYSYPEFFVKQLFSSHDLSTTKAILTAGNLPPPTMVRFRSDPKSIPEQWLSSLDFLPTFPKIAVLKNSQLISELSSSPICYIQNATPAFLMTQLAKHSSINPKSILDLCASPGGKLIAAHDLFPTAKLFGNDVSEEKIQKLLENFRKYKIEVTITVGKGENFYWPSQFDLIILDVPCSNSGVLNKRPEARWRLSQEALSELTQTQLNLIEHAKTLLSPQGEIWYLTCSILKMENEDLIKVACDKFGLTVRSQRLILPNEMGWDGGFGCSLSLSR